MAERITRAEMSGRAARSGDGLGGVGGDARGADHAVERQQIEVRGVERDVDTR